MHSVYLEHFWQLKLTAGAVEALATELFATASLPSLFWSLTDCYICRFVLSLMTPSRGEATEQ